MGLVSLRVPGGDCQAESVAMDEYGYGTRLCLSPAQVKALGIVEPLRAGTVVMVSALATVVQASESMDVDGDESALRLELQCTDMEISGGQDNQVNRLESIYQ